MEVDTAEERERRFERLLNVLAGEFLKKRKKLLLNFSGICMMMEKFGLTLTALPELKRSRRNRSKLAYLLTERNEILYEAPIEEHAGNYILAHELSHWLRGKRYSIHRTEFSSDEDMFDYLNEIEVKTDKLALDLVAPPFLFKFLASTWDIVPLAHYFNLQPTVILYRFLFLADIPCQISVYWRERVSPIHILSKQIHEEFKSFISESSEKRHLEFRQELRPNETAHGVTLMDRTGYVIEGSVNRSYLYRVRKTENERGILPIVRRMFEENDTRTKVLVRPGVDWSGDSLIQIIPSNGAWVGWPPRYVFVLEIPLWTSNWRKIAEQSEAFFPPWLEETRRKDYSESVNEWLNDLRVTLGLNRKEYKFDYCIEPFHILGCFKDKNDAVKRYESIISRYFEIASSSEAKPYMEGSNIYIMTKF